MANQFPISDVINISVATVQPGVNAYNTSNLAIFSDELPQEAVLDLNFSGVAASGAFTLAFGGNQTVSIAWNAVLATIQSDIAAVTGMSHVTVSGSIASGLVITQPGIYGPILACTVPINTLQTAGSVDITVTPVVANAGWSGGALGYSLYTAPTQVGVDFGTSSKTYTMANAVFSQQPNILTGGGCLVVIPMTVASQTLTLNGVPASGTFVFNYGGNASTAINWNDTAAQIQTKLQAMPGLSEVLVTGSLASELLTIQFAGVYGNIALATITSNTLQTSVPASISITVATSVTGEKIDAAITRTESTVQYFGIMASANLAEIGQTDLLAAAAVVQPLTKIAFWVSNIEADIQPGGMIDLLRTGAYTQSRGLYYDDPVELNTLNFMAAYAGLGLSTNFEGSNTTQTVHLKTLTGVEPDPGITTTILNEAQSAGADTYISIQGVSKVYSSGTNRFFDQVYNQLWFAGALQVAGFNYLATTNTKIPQTENGMDGLKGAYRSVCEQAVTNGYLAPGTWNSAVTFGNNAYLLNNVSQKGYYIYSSPIATQSETDRTARKAPLVQIAAKEAGAIQSSSVIVYINA